jgi:PAS domain S-box-containing protein
MDSLPRNAAVVLGLLAAVCRPALGLNPALDINQYAHKSWTIREGFFKGSIFGIAQTADGYLWLGAEFGLERFDGVHSVPWQPPGGEHLPAGRVRSLRAARDGRLWIGTDTGLASWQSGQLKHYPAVAGAVVSLMEDHEGTIWAGVAGPGRTDGRVCAIRNGGAECEGSDGSLGGSGGFVYEDQRGNLWAGIGKLVRRLRPAPLSIPPLTASLQGWTENDRGELLLSTQRGMKKVVGTVTEPYPLPGEGQEFKLGPLLRDRDRSLWITTVDGGVLHVHQGRTDRFANADGLSGDFATSLFEDHEGTIWVGTRNGLDRFRELPIATMTSKQGLSAGFVNSVLAARDGSVWVGTSNGLSKVKDGKVIVYGKRNGLPDSAADSLFQDQRGRIWISTLRGTVYFEDGRFAPVRGIPSGYVASIVGDALGGVWVSLQASLLYVDPGSAVENMPWSKVGRNDYALSMLLDPAHRGLWLGFRKGGVAYFKDHLLRASYEPAQGLGEGPVGGLKLDADGALWAATGGGLSYIKNGRVLTLSSINGLPCNTVNWLMEDDNRFFWLYTACGLVRIGRSELDSWTNDPKRVVHTAVYDNTDGVRSNATPTGNNPVVAKTEDGKIWFTPFDGVSVIDPRHLVENKLPPPVHIEQIIADGKLVSDRRLPPLARDLQIDYTALSLVAPEKNRFKYKLEGYDRDWQDAGNRRQAFYTNLPSRNYRFRVMASNNSGVWNETGDTLEFSIAPAYYQTNWFRALVAAVALVLMGMAYQFRIWRVEREARRLRDVIETIPAYVWSALPDGFVDFVNGRWLEFSGFSLDQAKGWGWADALHPEDRGPLLEAFRGAIASGKALEAEARMRSADGQYRWLLFRSVPQRDGSGKIVKWYGKSMDIDDRKRAEATLVETETRFRTYIDHATDAFFVLDFENGTILDANRQACQYLGYTREELIGKTVFEFDAGLDPEWLDRNVRPRIEAGESVTFETRHRRKDGSEFPVEIRARAFQTGGRTVNLSLVRDITERKRAEGEREQLRQLEADLAHINRVSMMGELAASVAHEVNQPLTGIVSNGSACLRFLDAGAPDLEEVREAVQDIVRDGKRAGEVIARIRALTKRTALPREKLDLNETVQEVLALAGDEARKKRVVVRTRFADDLAPVFGDRVQLQQVLLNLVINAMDAMSSVEDRERALAIATQNIEPDMVQVTVKDSGTGMDPKIMARIFEAFFTTKAGGMGMGLSICRSIVQNHGGRLWAEANDGPGTSFHFTLPKV